MLHSKQKQVYNISNCAAALFHSLKFYFQFLVFKGIIYGIKITINLLLNVFYYSYINILLHIIRYNTNLLIKLFILICKIN